MTVRFADSLYSFVVVRDHGIAEALTGEHHFEQAGFTVLLRQ